MGYGPVQTNRRGGAGLPSKAIRARAWSLREHQMYAAAALGNARGAQRHAPAVVYDDMQDWSASCRAGFSKHWVSSPVFDLLLTNLARVSARVLSHSHRFAGSLPSLSRSRVRVPSRRASGTHSMRVQGSRPSRAHTLGHQHLFQHVADLPHVSRRLSSSLFSSGIDPNENGLTHEAQPLPSRGKDHD